MKEPSCRICGFPMVLHTAKYLLCPSPEKGGGYPGTKYEPKTGLEYEVTGTVQVNPMNTIEIDCGKR